MRFQNSAQKRGRHSTETALEELNIRPPATEAGRDNRTAKRRRAKRQSEGCGLIYPQCCKSGTIQIRIAISERPAVACRALSVSQNHRLCCLDFHGVGVRHATRSAFKDILDIKVTKSRRSSERHNSSAAWATRRPWRVISRMFIAHGRKRSSNRNVVRRQTGGT